MDITYTEDLDKIDWDRLTYIYNTTLGNRTAHIVELVFRNSSVRCFAWDGPSLIGGGRAITDGVKYAVVFDLAVLPAYQGRGIGTKIIQTIMEKSAAENILLHSIPGKQKLYLKLGFSKMKTALAKFKHANDQRSWGFIE